MNEVEENLTAHLADLTYQVATGTATALIVPMTTLVNGYSKTFVASSTSTSTTKTINTKPFYKPGTTVSPSLVAGKAYTVWYDASGDCFFIKASAEGTATTAQVLAGVPFSNETDTGLVGTMINRRALTIMPGTSNKAIQEGYHSGLGIVQGSPNLLASNIRTGVNIFGVVGNLNPNPTLTDVRLQPYFNYTLSGNSAYFYYPTGVKYITSIIISGYGEVPRGETRQYSDLTIQINSATSVYFYNNRSSTFSFTVSEVKGITY